MTLNIFAHSGSQVAIKIRRWRDFSYEAEGQEGDNPSPHPNYGPGYAEQNGGILEPSVSLRA